MNLIKLKSAFGKIELEVHAHKEQTGYLKLLVRGQQAKIEEVIVVEYQSEWNDEYL
jgi:hypothetical protein